MNKKLQVAILGATGIGKNHAGWLQKHGAHVCAFLGSNEASVARTRETLRTRLGYAPRGYTDLLQLLKSENLDAVCIASPPQCHFAHVEACLLAGVPVLCEKPLVYDPNLGSGILIEQAHNLVEAARARNLLFGTQMQYCLIAEKLCELAASERRDVHSFSMEMETKNWKASRSHETVWIELAPHPIGVLQKIAGAAQLDLNSIECEITEWETSATFRIVRADKSTINAHIIARVNPNASTPLRRFCIDHTTIDYAARNNQCGEFKTYLSTKNHETEMPDLVDLLIDNFLQSVRGERKLKVTGADGAQNVAWLMQILDRGRN